MLVQKTLVKSLKVALFATAVAGGGAYAAEEVRIDRVETLAENNVSYNSTTPEYLAEVLDYHAGIINDNDQALKNQVDLNSAHAEALEEELGNKISVGEAHDVVNSAVNDLEAKLKQSIKTNAEAIDNIHTQLDRIDGTLNETAHKLNNTIATKEELQGLETSTIRALTALAEAGNAETKRLDAQIARLDNDIDETLGAIGELATITQEAFARTDAKVAENAEDIQTLNDNINSVSNDLAVVDEKVDTLRADVTTAFGDVRNDVKRLIDTKADKTDIENLQNDTIKALTALAEAGNTETKRLDNDIANVVGEVNAIAEQVEANAEDIQTLNDNINSVSNDLAVVDEKVDTLRADVTTAFGDVRNDVKRLIDTKADKTDIENLQNDTIKALTALAEAGNTETKRLDNDIANVVGEVNAIAEQVEANAEDIQTLNDNINSVSNDLDVVDTKVDALADATKTSFENVKATTDDLDVRKADKTALQPIADQASRADTNATTALNKANSVEGIANTANTKAGEALTVANTASTTATEAMTAVTGLTTRVDTLDNRMGAVEQRLETIDDNFKSGMAAQAALTGLFQPYEIGRANASVALGGYGSKTAIAVGAGYRFNEKFAGKIGLATGGDKPAYSIGVNFEFK